MVAPTCLEPVEITPSVSERPHRWSRSPVTALIEPVTESCA